MKIEIEKPRFYKRVFSAPALKLAIALIIVVAIIALSLSKSLFLMLFVLSPFLVLYFILFFIIFYKQRLYVKSIETNDELIIVIFKQDSFFEKLELNYRDISVNFYTLFLNDMAGYKEEYKVLDIIKGEKKIISQDAKNGWLEKDLNEIYLEIINKQKSII